MTLFSRLHARLGDLWWYAILLFAAQRVGDVINLFVGLWLVPKYVSQQELGAVLPLSQFASIIGLPMGLVAIPFMKFLSVYSEEGRLGKAKAMIRDVFAGTAVMSLLTFVVAYFLLPLVFERMRVATGALGVLIVLYGIASAASVIFGNAVQGLKLFSAVVWFSALAAPSRFLTMLVSMPFRPISGYFLGQTAAPGVPILGGVFALRKVLGRAVVAEPYWKEDGRAILRYTFPVAVLTIVGLLTLSVDQLVIRHRLSDFESAGYYIISRFAEISLYLGGVLSALMFPLVAGRQEGDDESFRTLKHTLGGALAGGLVVTALLGLLGDSILDLQDHWSQYRPFASEMVVLALVNSTQVVLTCFATFETARGHFRFFWYSLSIPIAKTAVLYLLTGYTFFEGRLPVSWMDAIGHFNPNRLSFILNCFLAANLLQIVCFIFDVFCCRRIGDMKSAEVCYNKPIVSRRG